MFLRTIGKYGPIEYRPQRKKLEFLKPCAAEVNPYVRLTVTSFSFVMLLPIF